MGITLCSSFVFLLWSTVKLLRRCGEEISNNQVQVEKKLLDPLKQAWMGAPASGSDARLGSATLF